MNFIGGLHWLQSLRGGSFIDILFGRRDEDDEANARAQEGLIHDARA
ncbi:hypothetical protein [Mesorhizobium sp.]|nr:hypothetical protein [Mesorhizobium sp.]